MGDLQSPAKSVGFILEQMGVTEGFQHKDGHASVS